MSRTFPLVALLLCAACSPEAPPERGPAPVVLFLVDTLRADHLGSYGYERATSPALDAMAQDGVVFDQCQAQSSWTKPASASILTGLLPSVHRATHKVAALGPEHLLLAEPLQAAGYRTAAFGSNGFIFGAEQGFGRGFDVFKSAHMLTGSHIVPGEVLVDAGLDWLDSELAKSDDERLFLYLHAVDPHDPYAPPADLRNRFSSPLASDMPTDEQIERPALVTERYPEHLPPEVLERMVGLYDAEILAADRAFGRLLDGLKERGLYDEALIVFVADHGEEFFDHASFGHNPRLFQEVLHVPLVIKFPNRMGKGLRARHFEPRVCQVDVLPTVLDSLGIELEPQAQAALAGSSLLEPLIQGGAVEEDWNWQPAVTEVDYEGIYRKSLITGSMKYVRTWTPEFSESLFDLELDPEERRDRGAHDPERVAKMREQLGELTRTGSGGWTLMLQNNTAQTLRVAALVTYSGDGFEGIDPKQLELDGMLAELADGPFDLGWVRTQAAGDGLATVEYGMGLSLETTEFASFPGPPLAGLKAYAGRAAWFTCVLEPGDGDGMIFMPGLGSKDLELHLWAESQPVDPGLLLLGADQLPAKSLPLNLSQLDEEAMEIASPPDLAQSVKDKPVFAWLWKNRDPAAVEAELSDETRVNLDKLGY